MTDVIDLSRLTPNLVTEFRDQATSLLAPGFEDFDGVMTEVADGHRFMFQYIKGQLAGAIVLSETDSEELARRILGLVLPAQSEMDRD